LALRPPRFSPGFDVELSVPSVLRAAANAYCAISGNGGVGAIVKISGLLDTTFRVSLRIYCHCFRSVNSAATEGELVNDVIRTVHFHGYDLAGKLVASDAPYDINIPVDVRSHAAGSPVRSQIKILEQRLPRRKTHDRQKQYEAPKPAAVSSRHALRFLLKPRAARFIERAQ
jgi:hypothetical protein